ncbi:4-demethylwyosine synthase TYW1 [Methanosalsum natronophilum]|uniref:S-adenosyl-L-methionine-dependent tRNA 4-demethylwyosine synthase n=1 Tax=Methanosalsum natronophilum TaxID=768733 RepID=A0A3R8CDX7_9EURY|nr:4-demethylwyosine synthase TYW1 [Methanosalsum natronophilum]MCS3923942.1 tRNA wybutosine-synthesizing protein 1 [Methanosalsum natronophilum]RQD91104.1 MAG: 4-demethylwyosine synthase TYW1 [Methanosalsum natronophilum]
MEKTDKSSDLDFNLLLKKQGYLLAGTHSAVKTCLWVGRSIKGEGDCYKSKFYGIQSHQCMQMSPTLICNQKCLHCWRPTETKIEYPKKWDSPLDIVEKSIASHRKLISGYGGSGKRNLWVEANTPKHVAISLAGEPTIYPYLPQLVEEFKQRKITTFVVTNGTNPDMIDELNPTQLYMSLDAPDVSTYHKVCSPCSNGFWDKINESLAKMKKKKGRKAIRLTLIKNLNMFNPSLYAKLISQADPDYVEVKAYMHLGFSRKRLPRESMPSNEEILNFSKELANQLDYIVIDNVETSRVVLLAKNGNTQINNFFI